MKLKNALIVYTKPMSNEEKTSLSLVKKTLNERGIRYKKRRREKLREKFFKNRDLIIAVGGDGTVSAKMKLATASSCPRLRDGASA